jgi:tRNA G18 (ribose-2'-O)-methylase SpoU
MIAACPDPGCRETFDVAEALGWRRVACPACGAAGPAVPVEVRRRLADRNRSAELPAALTGGVVAVLEDLRSVHNVGSIIRTCDALGVGLVVMVGLTPTPEHPRLAKTALGAERVVPWVWRPDALSALRELHERGMRIVALEDSPSAVPLADACIDPPVALVIGNEVAGISSPVLDAADRHLVIPMRGIKTSMNVAVAFGIAAYAIRVGIDDGAEGRS